MSREKFKVGQLEEELDRLKQDHKLELSEKNEEIKELKTLLKLKQRIENITHAEHTFKYFPALMLRLAKFIDRSDRLARFYVKFWSFLNYAFVCGVIGFLINEVAVHLFVRYMPLYLAIFFGMLVAVLWNWSFTVGPYGFIFGLSPQRSKVKKT